MTYTLASLAIEGTEEHPEPIEAVTHALNNHSVVGGKRVVAMVLSGNELLFLVEH